MLAKYVNLHIAMLATTAGLMLMPTATRAQTYQVQVEEAGSNPTVYTKRNNWRILPDYRHTTMVAKPGSATLCSESPCLDDDLPGGGEPPDSTRGGTATATVLGMSPGQYRVELRYNQTVNRATSVPWSLTTDGVSNNTRFGTLNQRDTAAGADNWLVLADSSQNPVDVVSTATFTFGSDTTTFNGSLSYGGVRLVKVDSATVPDAGDAGSSPGCPELRSAEYSNAEVELDVSLGSTDRLTFTIDDVPDPAGLDAARLSMWLRDADHPGQEGSVYVNGSGPLPLPADTAWNDVTTQAELLVPVPYLKAGHNVVEFGAGSLATTIYAVSRVALHVQGDACALEPDASQPEDAAASSDAWQPIDSGPGGSASADASTGTDGAAGSGTSSFDAAAGDDSDCACSVPGTRGSSAGCLALVMLAAVGWLRRSRASLA